MKKILFSFLALAGFTLPVWGQSTQFYLEDDIGGQLKTKIYLVGDAHAQSQIQESLYNAVDHARAAYKALSAEEAGSELSQLNQKKAAGKYAVGADLANAVSKALEISKSTGGVF